MEILDEKQRLANQNGQAQETSAVVDLDDGADALVTDGFLVPNLDSPNNAEPPAYGEQHDHVQFSQPGFDAGAEITGMFLPALWKLKPSSSGCFVFSIAGHDFHNIPDSCGWTKANRTQFIKTTAELISTFIPKIEGLPTCLPRQSIAKSR